jgi:uncharacterized membrane protein YfcA
MSVLCSRDGGIGSTSTTPQLLLIVSSFLALCGISAGLSGFGSSILFQVLWATAAAIFSCDLSPTGNTDDDSRITRGTLGDLRTSNALLSFASLSMAIFIVRLTFCVRKRSKKQAAAAAAAAADNTTAIEVLDWVLDDQDAKALPMPAAKTQQQQQQQGDEETAVYIEDNEEEQVSFGWFSDKNRVRWDVLMGLVPGTIVSVAIGNFVLTRTDNTALITALGLTFVFTVSWMLFKITCLQPANLRVFRRLCGGCCCCCRSTEKEAAEADADARSNGGAAIEMAPVVVFWRGSNKAATETTTTTTEKQQEVVAAKEGRSARAMILGGFIGGLGSGFLSGLFATGGPPVMLLWSWISVMTKGQMRATYAMLVCIVAPFRFVSLVYFEVMTSNEVLLYLAASFIVLIGVMFGNYLHDTVNAENVMVVLMCLVLVSAGSRLKLTTIDLRFAIVFTLFMIPVFQLVLYVVVACRGRNTKQ